MFEAESIAAAPTPKSRFRAQITEVINRNAIISLGLARGFNAFLPVYDDGIDFILHNEAKGILHKVQLKSRWTIDRKYLGRDIWVAFPIGADWYLMPHDTMLELAAGFGITDTGSWRERGIYSKPRPSKALVAACAPWRFGNPADVVEAAMEHASDREAA